MIYFNINIINIEDSAIVTSGAEKHGSSRSC